MVGPRLGPTLSIASAATVNRAVSVEQCLQLDPRAEFLNG